MEHNNINCLQKPEIVDSLEDSSPLLRSLRHFLNNDLTSRDLYDTTWHIALLNSPDSTFLSYNQVKQQLHWLSGVVPVEYDMCPDMCVAYTGPHAVLDLQYAHAAVHPDTSLKLEHLKDSFPQSPLGL